MQSSHGLDRIESVSYTRSRLRDRHYGAEMGAPSSSVILCLFDSVFLTLHLNSEIHPGVLYDLTSRGLVGVVSEKCKREKWWPSVMCSNH